MAEINLERARSREEEERRLRRVNGPLSEGGPRSATGLSEQELISYALMLSLEDQGHSNSTSFSQNGNAITPTQPSRSQSVSIPNRPSNPQSRHSYSYRSAFGRSISDEDDDFDFEDHEYHNNEDEYHPIRTEEEEEENHSEYAESLTTGSRRRLTFGSGHSGRSSKGNGSSGFGGNENGGGTGSSPKSWNSGGSPGREYSMPILTSPQRGHVGVRVSPRLSLGQNEDEDLQYVLELSLLEQ